VVDQEGNKKTLDRKGFAAIGTGSTLAYAEITRLLNYTPLMNEAQAIVTVYRAKKRAESAPGVGDEKTDLLLLSKDENNIYTTEIAQDPLKDILKLDFKSLTDCEKMVNTITMKTIEDYPDREKIFKTFRGKFNEMKAKNTRKRKS
jgi:hypothetical protein